MVQMVVPGLFGISPSTRAPAVPGEPHSELGLWRALCLKRWLKTEMGWYKNGKILLFFKVYKALRSAMLLSHIWG